jgi:hypothetical protein
VNKVDHGQVHQTGERRQGEDKAGGTLKGNEIRVNDETGNNIAWRNDAKAHQQEVKDSVHPDDPD